LVRPQSVPAAYRRWPGEPAMNSDIYTLHTGRTALLVSVPHAGTHIP
jgi:hypothetical protein